MRRMPMIARVWKGRTRKEHADVYWNFLTTNAEEDCRVTKGNCGVSVYRKVTSDFVDFMFISFWESMDVIQNYAGDDIDRAHYFPEDLKYVIDPPSHVEHFEVIEIR
jgi:heme-degrading monooxygenase HmoA